MPKNDKKPYDWAQAVLEVAEVDEASLPVLAKAAGLNPLAGDLSHVDLSGTSIEGQNLSGWDLSHAKFDGCVVSLANFAGAKLSGEQLVKAKGWRESILDEELHRRTAIIDAERVLNLGLFDFLVEALNDGEQRYAITYIYEILRRRHRAHNPSLRQVLTSNRGTLFGLMHEVSIGHYKKVLAVEESWLRVAKHAELLADNDDHESKQLLLFCARDIRNLIKEIYDEAQHVGNRKKKRMTR
jgi:hypothetical protein